MLGECRRVDLHTILSSADLGTLLLKQLTILEAGRLSGAYSLARTLVRRGEADDVFQPMWAIELVLARLERYRLPIFAAGGLVFRETTALARMLLTELLATGVIELRFDVHSLRRGHKQSLLGCTELHALDQLRFVTALQDWALRDTSCYSDGQDDDEFERRRRRKYPAAYVLDLLQHLKLKPATNNSAQFPHFWERPYMLWLSM